MKDLETRIQQAQERLNDLKAAARKLERRDATRRKIIYGAAVLLILEKYPDAKGDRLRSTLDSLITRQSDRKFLGLPKLQDADQKAD